MLDDLAKYVQTADAPGRQKIVELIGGLHQAPVAEEPPLAPGAPAQGEYAETPCLQIPPPEVPPPQESVTDGGGMPGARGHP